MHKSAYWRKRKVSVGCKILDTIDKFGSNVNLAVGAKLLKKRALVPTLIYGTNVGVRLIECRLNAILF